MRGTQRPNRPRRIPERPRRAARSVSRGLAGALTVAIVGSVLLAGATPASAFPAKLSANGQMDFVYGSAVNSAGGSGGTVYKPESKLFYTGDGTSEPVRWWAVLGTTTPASGVWLFELVNHNWVARIQLPQADPWAKADALFDAGTLYVSTRDNMSSSSANPRQSSLYRIPYHGGGTWGAVQGPFAITTGSVETLTLARDSADRIWVTYESGGQIKVGATASGGTSFTTRTVSRTNVKADDISAITAFGGNRIGVFWSDQNSKKDLFAWRPDSAPVDAAWTIETAYGGGVGACPTSTSDLCADDHMNVKVVQDQIYVAVKTSLNDPASADPNDPVTALLRRSSDGTWSSFPIATVSQNVTRPITVLSPEQDKIWVWGTRGSEVDVWESSFTSPSFTSTAFIPWAKGSSVSPADPTATKQPTTAASGTVVMASAASKSQYWHNEFLPPGAPPPNAAPSAQNRSTTATAGVAATIALTGTDAETCQLSFDRPDATLGSGATVGDLTDGPCSGGGPFQDTATVTYTAPSGFSGRDSFTYTVHDGSAGSNVATVSIDVTSPPSSTIALRASSFAANPIAQSLVIPVPTGVQAGDVMVAVVDVKAAPAVALPAGWTPVSDVGHGSNFRQLVSWRVATGSEPASYRWSYGENRAASGGIVAYSGVHTENPVETFSTGTGSTAAITAPSVTSAFDGAMIVGAFGINADSTIAPPAGMTERGEIVSATRLRTEISDLVVSSGPTGARTATAATASANIGQLVVLRPTDPPPPPDAPPTARDVTTTATAGVEETITLTGIDAESCELAFDRPAATLPSGATVSAPAGATCTGTGPYEDTATVTYTAPLLFSGPDSFTYTVNDGRADSGTATVSINVSPPLVPGSG